VVLICSINCKINNAIEITSSLYIIIIVRSKSFITPIIVRYSHLLIIIHLIWPIENDNEYYKNWMCQLDKMWQHIIYCKNTINLIITHIIMQTCMYIHHTNICTYVLLKCIHTSMRTTHMDIQTHTPSQICIYINYWPWYIIKGCRGNNVTIAMAINLWVKSIHLQKCQHKALCICSCI